MNDILPPKRPLSRPNPAPQAPPMVKAPETPLISPPPEEKLLTAPKKSKKWVLWLIGGVIAFIIAVIVSVLVWYKTALQPVNSADSHKIQVDIPQGTGPSTIGHILKSKGLIRSQLAFDIYTRLSHSSSAFQAGTYVLSPADSTPAIVGHITSGKADEVTITFLPGATVAEDKAVLLKAGYSQQEIDMAFSKTYDSPLFTDKPAGTSLEGYIYGETYNFARDATVEQILTKTFAEYESVVEDNNLVAGFKAQGLNLYQGITLASIIQREVSKPDDQRQVAQIFFKRLGENMTLGSDVTAYYGADITGQQRSVDVDTPYNTRLHTGLPVGPISSPGLTALQAVANPAPR